MKLIRVLLLLLLSVFLFSCHRGEPKNQIRVGTIAGPETQIMKVAANFAKKRYGLDVQIITFTHYHTPNVALSEGDIDANMFQEMPYLNAQIKAHGYQFTPIGKVFIYPMGIYSSQLKKLSALPVGAKVGIPEDPSDQARALLLLQKAGLITLKKNATTHATVKSVVSNPKKLLLITMPAVDLPRALSHLNMALINTNYAIPAGYYPSQALFLEGADSLYANVVVVRTKDKNDPRFKNLVRALHSQPVITAAQEIFGPGAAIPAWKRTRVD